MGLDAFVSCRCWQDGLTTPPPVPRELIVYTEDGLDLTIPYDGNEDLYRDLDNWVHSGACGHEKMDQASVHVSNWTGYRLFQEALKAAGWQHFPTLQAYLPQSNGGVATRPGSPPRAGRTAAVHQPDAPGHLHLPGGRGDRRTAE
jgi:hypothetical protein